MKFIKILIGVIMCSALLKSEEKLKFEAGFENNAFIPIEYTCEGENKLPEFSWRHFPSKTKSFAIICQDPDAPQAEPWVHWVIFNIPHSETKIHEQLGRTEYLPNGTTQGLNSFNRIGYDGPCPPPGKAHRYFFTLYALDTVLNLKERVTKEDLLKALQGHILAQAELIGLYEKQKR